MRCGEKRAAAVGRRGEDGVCCSGGEWQNNALWEAWEARSKIIKRSGAVCAEGICFLWGAVGGAVH